MKNIKKVLSAITALGLVTTVACSVTACSDNKILTLPVGVTSALDLTDDSGNPKITPNLILDNTTHKYSWTSNLPAITGKSLVKNDLSAKNDDCTSLLKTTFKLIPDINGKFDSGQLDKITAKISYVPSLSKNIDNDDFYVSGGSIQIQFVKDNSDIGEVYNVNLKSAVNTNQLINNEILKLSIVTADFNTGGSADGNPLFDGTDGFKVGETIKDLTNKECKLLSSDDSKASVNDKVIDNLNKILGTKITIKIKTQSQATGQWSAQDFVTLQYSFTRGTDSVTIVTKSQIIPNP